MQRLISHNCVLPSLLENLDSLPAPTSDSFFSMAREVYGGLDSLLSTVEDWETTYWADCHGPMSQPILTSLHVSDGISQHQETESIFPVSWLFPNITIANTITHYWALTIVVLSSIKSLHRISRNAIFTEYLSASRHSLESLEAKMTYLASNICQSMEYLTDDKMKVYGPASAVYPLSVALIVFRDQGIERHRELNWCERLIALLVARGIVLAKQL